MKYLLIAIFFTQIAFGQDARFEYGLNLQKARSYPLEITLGNHSVTMPFRQIFRTPIHPAIGVGTEWAWKEKNQHKVFSPLKFGFFYNRYNTFGPYLTLGLGYRYTHPIGLFADVAAEIGYLHYFRPFAKLVKNGDLYESKYDFGKPSVMLTSLVSVGYDFYQNSELPLSIFVRYLIFAQTPYNDTLSNVLPQAILMIGGRWAFGEVVRCPK